MIYPMIYSLHATSFFRERLMPLNPDIISLAVASKKQNALDCSLPINHNMLRPQSSCVCETAQERREAPKTSCKATIIKVWEYDS